MWFRFDCDACDAGWTGDLPGEQFACWVKLIGMVKIADGRGGTISTGKFTEATILRKNLGWDSWLKMLGAAELNDAITVTDGKLKICNWWKYQPDGGHAERQRRYRESKQCDEVTGVTSQASRDANITQHNITEHNKRKTPPNPPKGDPFFGLPLPEHLDTPKFRSAWDEWVVDRKRRRRPLTEGAVKRQLKKLEPCSEQQALDAIDAAIDGGWQSFFPKDDKHERKTDYGSGLAGAKGDYPQPEQPGDPF